MRLGIERRNFSFPAPRPFYSATGKRRLDTTDQSSIRPSLALARPGPQSSAAFSSHQSSQNHPAPTPRRNQISIDGQLPRRCPAGAFFRGSRTSALGPCPVDCSPCAGIRNPNRRRPDRFGGSRSRRSETSNEVGARHVDREVIIPCERWYLRFKLLVEMMAEPGLSIAHTTIMRWVQCYAPEFEKR